MTISTGNTASADEVLQVIKVEELYTGNGFDSNDSEGSYELTAIAASKLVNASYIKISITGQVSFSSYLSGGYSQLKAQIKETGGAYADVVAYKTVAQVAYDGLHKSAYTYIIYATVTAGMKTNGCQVKAFSNSLGDSTRTAAFVNIQTVLEVVA